MFLGVQGVFAVAVEVDVLVAGHAEVEACYCEILRGTEA